MDVQTNLLHFDDRTAICSASISNDETHVTVYATASVSEVAYYAELAQNRAIEAALLVLKDGPKAILEAKYEGLQKTHSRAAVGDVGSDPVKPISPILPNINKTDDMPEQGIKKTEEQSSVENLGLDDPLPPW